jgi:hypothetical protein
LFNVRICDYRRNWLTHFKRTDKKGSQNLLFSANQNDRKTSKEDYDDAVKGLRLFYRSQKKK